MTSDADTFAAMDFENENMPACAECVHAMICTECGLELDGDMAGAIENGIIEEACECECHTLV